MLRTMRSDFKKYSWTLWLVIIAFVLFFGLPADWFKPGEKLKSGLIYIDDEIAFKGDDFQRRLMRKLENYKAQFKNNFNKNLINQLRVPEQTLQELMNLAVMHLEAERLNIAATDEEVKNKVINFPSFQRDGKFIGRAQYLRALAYSKMTPEEFEGQLRDQLVMEKFQLLVTGALVIDNETLKDNFIKEKDKAELDIVIFQPNRIKDEIPVDDAEIAQYYEKNKEDFKSQEKRAGYVIALKFEDMKKEATVSEKEKYEYFKAKKADFLVPGKTKVSRILLKYEKEKREEVYKTAQEVKKELTKENFAEKSRHLSEDAKAEQGGDYGFEGWKNFTSQERAIIAEMATGEISTPVDTREGFSIILVSEKVAEKKPIFNEVKERVTDIIQQEKVNALTNEKLQKVYKKLAKADDIKAKAGDLGVTVVETGSITNGAKIQDVDDLGYISRRLFSLEEKEVAFPVNFVKGLAIVQLTKIEEPQVEPLDAVKDKVKDKVATAKKLDMLLKDASDVAAGLNKINDPDETKINDFLEKKDLKTAPLVYKRGNKFSYFEAQHGMDDRIFASEENTFTGPLKFKERVVIYKVKSKTITGDADFDNDKTEYYTQKADQMRNSFFSSYMSSRMEAHRVWINQDLFQKIKEGVMARYSR